MSEKDNPDKKDTIWDKIIKILLTWFLLYFMLPVLKALCGGYKNLFWGIVEKYEKKHKKEIDKRGESNEREQWHRPAG